MTDSNVPMMIIGDLNANGNQIATNWLEMGLTEHIEEHTWFRGNMSSKADALLTRFISGTTTVV